MTKTYVLLEIEHAEPIAGLDNSAAVQVAALPGIESIDARILTGGEYLLPVVDRGAWYGGPQRVETKA